MKQIDWVEELEKKEKEKEKVQEPGYGLKYHTDTNGNVYFELISPYENYEHYRLYNSSDTNAA
jgi:hypothetical protein